MSTLPDDSGADWDRTGDKDVKKQIHDYLLALFVANNAEPIRGRIMLIKQAFILFKEIVPELKSKVKFFPYEWGPYSNDIAAGINEMITKGYIGVRTEGRDKIYYLTPLGLKQAKSAIQSIPKDYLEDIERMKMTTQEMGLSRLLRFIYSNYPQYAKYSRGRETYVTT